MEKESDSESEPPPNRVLFLIKINGDESFLC